MDDDGLKHLFTKQRQESADPVLALVDRLCADCAGSTATPEEMIAACALAIQGIVELVAHAHGEETANLCRGVGYQKAMSYAVSVPKTKSIFEEQNPPGIVIPLRRKKDPKDA